MKTYLLFIILAFGFFETNGQNYSLDFDGIDDLVSSPIVNGTFHTIEFWFNADTETNGESTVTLPVNFNNEQQWIAFNNSTSGLFGETVSLNNYVSEPSSTNFSISKGWHHIAFVSDGTKYNKIYVDGNAVNMLSINSPVISDVPVYIGYRLTPSSFGKLPYKGKIDEFRIWNTSRSATEISQNMFQELTGNEQNLLFYYKMNNYASSCDVEDCNLNESHGIKSGSSGTNNLPQYSPGVPNLATKKCEAKSSCQLLNYSIDFDGIDDLIISPIVNGTFHTIEFWFNADTETNGESTVTLPVNFNNEQQWIAFNNSTSGLFGETVSLNNYVSEPSSTNFSISKGWHHIAFVSDGTKYNKIYVDGNAVNMLSINSPVISDVPVYIGYRLTPSSFGKLPYKGKIDEFRIWNTSRSATEISQNMFQELTGNEQNLLFYYKMNNYASSCNVEDCNLNESHGIKSGSSGTNNLPQYSPGVPNLETKKCETKLNCTVTNIEQKYQINEITLSPNPSDGLFEINGLSNIVTLKIFNKLGKMVKEINQTSSIADISSLPTDIYCISIITENGIINKFILKK